MSTPEPRNTKSKQLPYYIYNLAYIVGLFSALYSILLKYGVLPCMGTGCMVVLSSVYSELFGIPVSFFALNLWLLIYVTSGYLRTVATLALTSASLSFLYIQLCVLHTFCPICCLHTTATLGLLLGLRYKLNINRITLALAILFSFSILPTLTLFNSIQSVLIKAPLTIHSLAYKWCSTLPQKTLLLRLRCPHCIKTLTDMALSDKESPYGIIMIYDTPEESEITTVFLAAVEYLHKEKALSYKDALATTLSIYTAKQVHISNYTTALETFTPYMPNISSYIKPALKEMTKQRELLRVYTIIGTPSTILEDNKLVEGVQ